MKKRGQLPNARTFTIIFRGCADSQHPKIAVGEALKHYNVLLHDRRLQPNAIHLNAVLNACAKAGDLDSLFLVAKTANDSTRAPTAFTYTIIFNALRYQCLLDLKELPSEHHAANLQKNIDRAKGLWAEVVDKNKQGRLLIDEALVCSMGRLLILAPRREHRREVLDLLQQAMNIPNLSKPLSADPDEDPETRDVALPDAPPTSAGSGTKVYPVPRQNTLALVLTAMASTKEATVGTRYWNLLVRHYGVVPDRDNWLRMLGMLKLGKSSARAAHLVESMPSDMDDPKPYRIAMETCIRDHVNRSVVDHSKKILDAMLNRLPSPDLHTLRLYLRVALVSHSRFRTQAQGGDELVAKRAYGSQILDALADVWTPYKQVHFRLFHKAKVPDDGKAKAELYNQKREVVALARLIYSAACKIINEELLRKDSVKLLHRFGSKINNAIKSFYSNRHELEPNLPSLGFSGERDPTGRNRPATASSADRSESSTTSPGCSTGRGVTSSGTRPSSPRPSCSG